MSLTGYRAFRLDFTPTRVGLHGARKPWDAAEMVAVCDYSKLSLAECHAAGYEKHDTLKAHPELAPLYRLVPPERLPREHDCGIYSFKSALNCWQEAQKWGDDWLLLAEVENYGEIVVETERGYRSSQTRIRELFYLAPARADADTTLLVTRTLARKYGVPVSATSLHRLLEADPEYVDWVGKQQVEATDRLLNYHRFILGGMVYGLVPQGAISSFLGAGSHYTLTNSGGSSTWQTSGSPSAFTPTSLPSSPSFLSASLSRSPSVPLPSPSRRERFMDWLLLDSPLWVAPVGVGMTSAAIVGLIAGAVAALS